VAGSRVVHDEALPTGPEPVTQDPFNAQTPLVSLDEVFTPVDTFFVRDHFGIPQIDSRRWRLGLSGAVQTPHELTYDELLALDRHEIDLVLECAGNGRSLMSPLPPGLPWGERAVGCARFGGVPFCEVAARAGVDPAAVEFVFTGADTGDVRGRRVAFERSLPVDVALHPDTLLATHMNGEPLTARHGAPVRLAVPGRYGMADVKWLVGVRAVTTPFAGTFQADDYVYLDSNDTPVGPVTTMQVKSLITSPAHGASIDRGALVDVRGWAWSGAAAIRLVEVRLDDTDWYPAKLTTPSGPYAWTAWYLRWVAKHAGRHRVLVRATDENGDRQPLEAAWNAKGYGWNAAAGVDVVVR
jgi:DMSO/TMAO reductase YedYZ molybdopterin-dependent catalytic subunit